MKNSNNYDRLDVNINQLFDSKLDVEIKKYPSLQKRLFNRYSNVFLIKSRLLNPLIEAGFINKWFNDFKNYWFDILEGQCIFMIFIFF